MGDWFAERILATGRLPLFCFFVGVVLGFVFIRVSVRLIRAQVRWWPGNVTPGGMHIHHMVFGVAFMVAGGLGSLAVDDDLLGWRAAAAALFGVGTALVLDEFALILHLEDVYWSTQGRTSVDTLFVVVAVTALLLMGMHPFLGYQAEEDELAGAWRVLPLLVGLALATVTVLKGKIWTGLLGLFIPLFVLVGALRLARPTSPWARWRYRPDRRRGVRKLARAHRRERRLRDPVRRAKDRLQDLIAGRPDS